MLKFSEFHFKKHLILCLGVFGLMTFTLEASAQSENEKVEEIYPKTNDRVILEDHTIVQDNPATKNTAVKPINSPKVVAIGASKKELTVLENASDREVKKNESPSTLSFNIFLYIVDKFKAD